MIVSEEQIKRWQENAREFLEKMERRDEYVKRWLLKFHNMTPDERLALVKKIDAKYKSDEYRNRFVGIVPPYVLIEWLFDYGSVYGESIEYMTDGYFPVEQYKIDDSIVVSRMYGQGDFTYIEFLDADLKKRQLKIDFFNAWKKFAKEWCDRLDGDYSIKGTIDFKSLQHYTKNGIQKFTMDCSRFDITEPELSKE